ncbi:MAG: nodulation protein NfeD [Micromonosporaceae bacterium]|nr:nodulation protein NfeD [Micromonosporaceae bacterium]
MRRCHWRLVLAFISLAWLSWLIWLPTAASAGVAETAGPLAQGRTVLVARVDGAITPVTAKYLTDGVEAAEDDGRHAYLVEIDTPGGLSTSMRDIIKSFLGTRVPVIVYVTPTGGRAASAGALITLSSHVAAMAPGTTIGAATPVNAETGETASDKVINDAAAYAESVAAERGRNTAIAAEMVRSGTAITADRAREADVVDLIADDRSALLRAVDGRTVDIRGGSVTLHTADARVVEHEFGFMRQVQQLIADPNIAFLLMSIGTLAVIYELANPGMGFAGIAGAIMLILGFFALSVLPVNVAGVLLLLLAAGLFVAEIITPGVGVFAAGGTVALVLAGIFLFEGPLTVRLTVLIPTALVVGGGTLFAGRLAWRARRASPVTGRHALIGRTGEVTAGGQTLLEGAWWTVRGAEGPLRGGQTVRITDVVGLVLIGEPIDDGQGEPIGDEQASGPEQWNQQHREGES